MSDPRLLAAQAEAEAARSRLFATLGEVKARLQPSNLAHETVETVTNGLASAGRKSADVVRTRPAATAAIAGTVGLVLARGWIARLFRHGRTGDETAPEPKGLDKQHRTAKRAKKGSSS